MVAFPFFIARSRGPKLCGPSVPSQLQYRHGFSLFATLFGLPFLGAGMFLLYGLLVRLSINLMAQGAPKGWDWLVLLATVMVILTCALLFGAVGFWCVFGRSGTVIDREASTVTLWWSIPFRRRSEVHELTGYTGASVSRTGGSWKTGPTYSVFLTGATRQRLEVATVTVSHERAGRLATEITEFLTTNDRLPQV